MLKSYQIYDKIIFKKFENIMEKIMLFNKFYLDKEKDIII